MYKTWAVMFMDKEIKKPLCDTFYCRSEAEARRDFHECYRHAEFIILAVAEIPE